MNLTSTLSAALLALAAAGAANARPVVVERAPALAAAAVEHAYCRAGSQLAICATPGKPEPLPEPKAYWMLLVGLGLLGLSASRREASNKFSA